MKNSLSKNLFAIIVLFIISHANTFAQTSGTTLNSGDAYAPNCKCTISGYGCGLNGYCKLYCIYHCHYHVAITNGEEGITNIAFYIEKPQLVSLSIFDLNGNLVTTLANTYFSPGEYMFPLNSQFYANASISPGVYSVRMNSEQFSESERLVLL
jgi:hypothetical protein